MSHNVLRGAIFVDCDNFAPAILEYAMELLVSRGRIILRRAYGNYSTLVNKWQNVLLSCSFTPCLQYQAINGKNTADLALAIDALEVFFDGKADFFCLVTSDSDFAYLCRKMREYGSTVYVVGENKTPMVLRDACDQFFEWSPSVSKIVTEVIDRETRIPPTTIVTSEKNKPAQSPVKTWPTFLSIAVREVVKSRNDSKVNLGALGKYLKSTYPHFSPKIYGHSKLVNMVKTCNLLTVHQCGKDYWVSLKSSV